MLNPKQLQFRKRFLSPFTQKLYYLRSLPIALITGIRLAHLDETVSIAEVPYRWMNKNPFASMYFAVQSMAAELSTAAHVILSLEGFDSDVAFIIVEVKASFVKKAQSKIIFTCMDYYRICETVKKLRTPGDTVAVKVETVGRDINEEEVAVFSFTWSFKLRS
jgi:hypothetical protein